MIVLFLTVLGVWFGANFFAGRDSFLNDAPAEAAVYWHESRGREVDKIWLYDATERLLLGDASAPAKFLFENVAPEAREISFAILPGFEDFIFWAKMDTDKLNEFKEKLEKLNFSYLAETDGKAIISNSQNVFLKMLAKPRRRNPSPSLPSEKGEGAARQIAFYRAARSSAAQIYLGENFQFKNFSLPEIDSDFLSGNKLLVSPKISEPKNFADYDYLLVLDEVVAAEEIKESLKSNLAALFPEKREKILPDGAVVREIIANPELFQFEKKKIGGREIDYLLILQSGQEIFVAEEDKTVIVSDGNGLLIDYLANLPSKQNYYGITLFEIISKLAKWITPDFGGVVLGVDLR